MKKPTWVTIVGVLGIIFGCLGILGGGQEIMMPKIMKMQKEMWTAVQQQSLTQSNNNQAERGINQANNVGDNRVIPNPPMLNVMKNMFDVPEWFGGWSIFAGSAKALISAFYLFASIWLLQLKQNAIKLFYWALGSNIFLSILKAAVGLYAFSFMTMAMQMGGLFGALIDVVLIIVVATSDRSAFNRGQETVDKADLYLTK
ncbi:MAG: hypothetical protein P4L91_17935 [Burkholderiaceae bacterium]|nr:hypothetical protein [Burkholderiaceae bacterium]